MNGTKQKEYGDYQTPLCFAGDIVRYIKSILVLKPDTIIEPTCGIGNFLRECAKEFPDSKLIGLEINQNYIDEAKRNIESSNAEFYCGNVFDFDFSYIESTNKLVIGNPPWVTNSALSSINSKNIPTKSNLKKLKGFDALTGMSNFDICESIFLNLINAFKNTNTTIALLCKTGVARNVFIEMLRQKINLELVKMVTFNAKQVFNISADACLFIIQLSTRENKLISYDVFSLDRLDKKDSTIQISENGNLKKTDNNVFDFDGNCCFNWRQGVKHDCSKIMELKKSENGYINGLNEIVDIENDLVFPLIKSSNFKSKITTSYSKYVLITQKYVKENTAYIKQKYPKTWKYLISKKDFFQRRGSSIYKNSYDFSIFGIGDYSFSKYKVGISGFYKQPLFSLITNDTPAMLDDTCYFLNFDTYGDAYVAMLLLNNNLVKQFIQNIDFIDSKRPFTKKLLSRIDFRKTLEKISFEDLKKDDDLSYLTNEMFKDFNSLVNSKTQDSFL
jgi:16S rRNA A1518/A1519 N6-dimethyltransferase RsmA/KsgA/DIM1 with predicted DNA glycosylase/AP lyase activity